ncbi:hypothetical protein CD152_09380 [Macrococcoides caseolyticum]|nr:hypothetical protein CD152_09380 [Macrococcus caseolyticus]
MDNKRYYILTICCVFIVSILYHGTINLIYKHPFLTINELIHDVLPYIFFISIGFYVYYKKEQKKR